MSLTYLQIVQTAQAELGLPKATTVTGATDFTTMQMGALANRVLDELRRMHRWTDLQFEYDLVIATPIKTTGDLTVNSPIITNIPDTTGLQPQQWMVSGSGIPMAARVITVDGPHQVTLSMNPTGTVVGTPLTFSNDTYPMPVGFDWFNNRTMWDRTNRWELLGPDSPQMDQWHRSGIVVTGPRRHFRKVGIGNTPNHTPFFRIWPQPSEIATPLQLVFEYLSDAAVVNQGTYTNFTKYFQNDNDEVLLDDQAIIMGIEWMFWEKKGFNFASMQNRWVDYCNRLIARDGAAPTLNLVKRVNPIFISPANVQDGFYPGPVGPNMG